MWVSACECSEVGGGGGVQRGRGKGWMMESRLCMLLALLCSLAAAPLSRAPLAATTKHMPLTPRLRGPHLAQPLPPNSSPQT